jgi:WD40 repeat protein
VKRPTKLKLPSKVLVFMLAIQPEGNLLAAACNDGTVKLWNLESKEELLPLIDLGNLQRNKRNIAKVMKNSQGVVFCVSFSRNGESLLYGDEKGFVFFWKVGDETSLVSFKRISEEGVIDVNFFGNEKFLALVKESRIVLIEVVLGKVLASPIYTLPYSDECPKIHKCLFVFESKRFLLFWPPQHCVYLLEVKKESKEEVIRHLPSQKVVDLIPSPIKYPPFFYYHFGGKLWSHSVQSNESVSINETSNVLTFFVQPMNNPTHLLIVLEKEVLLVDLLFQGQERIEGCYAVFSGDNFAPAEYLIVLGDDRMTVKIYSIVKKKFQVASVNLKIKKIFPSLNKFGITYETAHEHSIRLSKGFKTSNLEDAELDSLFRLEYDEILQTLEWHTENERLAVASNKRICILTPSLHLLKTYNLLSPPLSIYWFGSTLLFSTIQGIYYCGDSFKLLLNTFSPSLICAVLVDRIYLFNSIELKAFPCSLTEPLLYGALSSNLSKDQIEKLCLLLPSSSISSDLLLKLLQSGFAAAASFLSEKTFVPLETKLEIDKAMQRFNDLEKTLFREKSLNEYQNLSQDIHFDHNWKLEKSLLPGISSFLDKKGQFSQLSKFLKLNKNFYELSLLHLSLGNDFPPRFDLMRFEDFSQETFLRVLNVEPHLDDLKVKEVEKLLEVKLGFGEVAFSQMVGEKEILAAYSENLNQVFGWDSLKPAERVVPKFIEHEIRQEQMEEDDNDLIYLYFRCDEGKGNCLNDVVSNKVVRINDDQWAGMLEEGEPLDYDDKWGKQASPSYRVLLFNDSFVIVEELALGKAFSIEFWISINEDSCNLLILGSFMVQIDHQKLKLLNNMTYLDQETTSDYRPLKLNTWEHFCISINDKRVSVFLSSLPTLTTKPITIQDKSNLTIGGFSGHITEIRIWNSFRSSEQIRENFKCPLEILSEIRKKKWLKLKINKNEAKPEIKTERKPEIKLSKPDSGPKPEMKPGLKKLAPPSFQPKFPKPVQKNPLEPIFKLFELRSFSSVLEEIEKISDEGSKEKTNFYKFVAKMMINIEKYKKSSRISKHLKAAACLNLLIKVKLNAEHRKMIAKDAIRMNIQINNFGIASKLIYNLLDHCEDSESQELEELLAECVANESQDKAEGFDEIFSETQEYFSSKLNEE